MQGRPKKLKICILIVFFIFISNFSQVTAIEPIRSTILTAERINESIVLDGREDEAPWLTAHELIVPVKDGGIGEVDVSIKALYDNESIYFFMKWEDPTESISKNMWVLQDSNWSAFEDEDRMAFIWNIESSIDGFDIAGCGMLCHGDRMHTNAPDEKGDVWHWKASRGNPAGFVDDGWLDHKIVPEYTEEAQEAGLHDDFGNKIYEPNINEYGRPLYYEPITDDEIDRQFLFRHEIENGEATEVDERLFDVGQIIPGYILNIPSDSRADIPVTGRWADGRWHLEFMRKLKTGHADDVQFDTAKIYRFGIAIMDNSGGFEAYGKGHSFVLGARTLEFGGKGSKEIVELSLVSDYLVTAKAYVVRGQKGLALSTISDALAVFNRIRASVAEVDPELFIKTRNGFVDSRRNPTIDNIDYLLNQVDFTILTYQGKRIPPETGFALKILVFWGEIQLYVFIALALLVLLPIFRMVRIGKRPEFRYLSLFMLMIITPIFLEGAGRLGALLKIPLLQNLSFTTSEYVTLIWAFAMFIALYIGRIGFNEIDEALNSLRYYSRELEKKMEELKRSQEQLLKSERLASIGQLSASMAHELRNPLGVMKNISYFLRMGLGKKDEKVDKHLNILEQELNISNKIISDLLDFSRGSPPVMKQVDLNRILKQSVQRVETHQNIVVEFNLERKLPKVMADSEQLTRVFINLTVNAVQAMHEGGVLTIVSKKEAENVLLEFTDTGTGISAEILSQIFEPLYSTKSKGIGLGLALSKQIIEMHGGSIDAISEAGTGTTFRLKLPIS